MSELDDAGSTERSNGRLVKQHTPSIVVGLVSSRIFIYLLDPILGVLSRYFILGATVVSHAYVDRLYAQAAHLETQDYSFLALVGTVGVFSALPLIAGASLLRRSIRQASPANRSSQRRSPDNGRVPGVPRSLAILGVGIFYLAFGLAVMAANYIQLSLTSSFRQHMRIVAPFISDQEEEELVGQWSQIQTKRDYDVLQERLLGIARRSGLTLPENKLYSPFAL